MKIKIEMETGNAAFESMSDVVTALRELAHRIESGQSPSKVMDGNGNAVGTVKITVKD